MAPAVKPSSLTRSIIVALALILPAFGVLVGLGVWQLQRKAWKEGLIAQIEARAYGEPSALPAEAAWPLWTPEAGEYSRVRATGTFLYDRQVAVSGLAPGEGPGRPLLGFYIVTPLRLADGSHVLVNRGFVSPDLKANPPQAAADPVSVTGLLRGSEQAGAFTPANEPAKGAWYSRDIAAIAGHAGLARVAPFLIDADASSSGLGGVPRGGLTRLEIPNRHLEYALTWFGLAATLLGVTAAAWFVRTRRKPAPDAAKT